MSVAPEPLAARRSRPRHVLLAFWSATTIIGAMIGLGLNIGGVPNAFVAPLIGIAIGALPGCIGAVYLNFGLRAPKAG